MGSPVSGRVAYSCALDRTEGLFHPPILNCFAIGSPYGSSVVFLPTRSERSRLLDSWSVFLQDGVTLFRSGCHDLISSEGIPRVGLMGVCFPDRPRDEFRHPLVDWSALKSGRVPHSVISASGEDSVCTPLANEGLGLDPSSSSGPVASRPPLGIGLLRRPRGDSFHLGVFMRWSPRMVAR